MVNRRALSSFNFKNIVFLFENKKVYKILIGGFFGFQFGSLVIYLEIVEDKCSSFNKNTLIFLFILLILDFLLLFFLIFIDFFILNSIFGYLWEFPFYVEISRIQYNYKAL